MSGKYDVAVVGATGAVGEAMLEILAERKFPAANVYALASERSAGKQEIVAAANASFPRTITDKQDCGKVNDDKEHIDGSKSDHGSERLEVKRETCTNAELLTSYASRLFLKFLQSCLKHRAEESRGER